MPENIFWLRLWQSVIVGLCVVVACISGCVAHSNNTIEALVKSGADPIKANCAVYGLSNSSSAACVASMIKPE